MLVLVPATAVGKPFVWYAEVVGMPAGARLAAALPTLGTLEGPSAAIIPAAEQRKAVNDLLGEGAASLEAYAQPAVVERVNVYGGHRSIDWLQAEMVADMLNGAKGALLQSQW